jgi:hypothetical protein
MDSAFALRFAPAPWNDRLDRSGSGMTVSGTNRTDRAGLLMSVLRGRPELIERRSKRRF